MPRAGDRTAYSLPRIVAELGYLSCVAVSCYVEREYLRIDGRHIPPHLVNLAALHIGIFALGKNIILLILDKIDSPNAREDWRDRRLR
ncbi:hypothetical protein BDA96_01G097000 [Sorghum bicolor]|uniref:Uncharacterized protein n=2 Tax=Sorghum bicolor TaxID=4558 RepID=A0A921UX22_SORBI|nr:hypothetical protein BDA96_01G097000 [Sorghum bicolor]OQU91006.1 hypothetical protein SORBI_3001G092650 [Sorghum bicolor]